MHETTTCQAGHHNEIAALVHRYAQFVRQGRGEACSALFISDSLYEIWEVDRSASRLLPRIRSRMEGQAGIHDYLSSSTSRGIRLCPKIHNLLIDIEGDNARGSCVMEARAWPSGHETIGEYADTFLRRDGKWWFAARKFTMFLGN